MATSTPDMTSRERVLKHLSGETVDRLPLMPITMMFACRRIGATYRDYCTDYRVMVEGQVRVSEDFSFDYVNTMSDPAREAADCGAAVQYFDNQPVAIIEERALLEDKSRLLSLKQPDPLAGGRMHNGIQALALYRERLGRQKIIEGWVEGPIAQAADLRGINRLMLDFYDDPAFVRDLFEFVLEMELRFAREQIRAGADLIGIGDAAASLAGPDIYRMFVWPFEKRLVDGIRGSGGRVRLHICGNTRKLLSGMGELGCEIVDLDSMVPVAEARAAMRPGQVLLGNLNPVHLMRDGTPDSIRQAIAQCHRESGPAFIVGAGCEIPQDTPPENLRALCEYAHTSKP